MEEAGMLVFDMYEKNEIKSKCQRFFYIYAFNC